MIRRRRHRFLNTIMSQSSNHFKTVFEHDTECKSAALWTVTSIWTEISEGCFQHFEEFWRRGSKPELLRFTWWRATESICIQYLFLISWFWSSYGSPSEPGCWDDLCMMSYQLKKIPFPLFHIWWDVSHGKLAIKPIQHPQTFHCEGERRKKMAMAAVKSTSLNSIYKAPNHNSPFKVLFIVR